MLAGGRLEIRPGASWLRVTLPGRLRRINLWLLEDGDHWTPADTGLNLEGVQQTWERLATGPLRDKPAVRLCMAEATARRARFLLDSDLEDRRAALDDCCALHGIPCAEHEAEFIAGQRYRQAGARLPGDLAVLDHERPLVIGARERLPPAAHGRAEDRLSLFCPDLSLPIAGDQALPAIAGNAAGHFNNVAEDALAECLESMERFAALPRELLTLPSHGRVFANLRNRMAAVRHSQAR